ncbi:hypothetical protein EIN_390390 [Entamoeba invadens IP1]|uniref:Leucine rich repeat containing protein BspA family protein n=1 Tax=Entamoeba invadens IP1 TaxID=370355 RepID=A0A0A1U558_ENTIV|nr:hypothetical protein EIN_390390 [Entamoeba invadens IP1]ELP89424.1 hypothetical protein EIN_390390 [Entamoeba invadens IP1]|eukprot:XP_004256195.1 hypothetical protein EIN_390390 [Entamoeba invadens IP1]
MHKVDVFSMQIITKYFTAPKDFISIILVSKKYEFLLDRFRENPIPIYPDTTHLFPNIQTQVLFTPFDVVLPNIDRHVYLYYVSYDEFKEKNSTFEIYKKVHYTHKDVSKYGLHIPENVFVIASQAFSNQEELTSFDIPSYVTEIGTNAFDSCGLEKLYIPESVRVIQKYAFVYCEHLKHVILPENITVIPESCFSDCTMLETINFPTNLINIGKCAFSGVNLKEVKIPNNCRLGSQCFENCEQLTKVVLNGIRCISDSTFENCKNLKEVVDSEELEEIGEYAFEGCEKLEMFIFGEHLKFVGNSAFIKCQNLRKVILQHVNYVGDFAFLECKNLEELAIKNKNCVIGNSIFENCDKLSVLEIPNYNTEMRLELTENEIIILNKLHINTTEKCVECVDDNFQFVEKENVDFSKYQKIKNFKTNEMKKIDLNTSVEQIMCNGIISTSLTSLYVPSSVVLTDNYCVNQCKKLKNFVLPKHANCVENHSVTANYITNIEFPQHTTKLSKSAFEFCRFKTFKIPAGIKEVEEDAIFNCYNLEKIVVPSTVTKISKSFVTDCQKLTEIKIENKALLDTQNVILRNHNVLTNILDIPDYVRVVENLMNFDESVTKLVIPNTITYVKDNALSSYENLKELILPTTLKVIGKHIFSLNEHLSKIQIGNNTKEDFDKYVVNFSCHLRLLNYGFHFDNIEFTDDDYLKIGKHYNQVMHMETPSKFVTSKTIENKVYENVPNIITDYSQLIINTNHFVIPKDITEMVEYGFYKSHMHSVDIVNVTIIEDHSFAMCFYLTRVVLPNNLLKIKNAAFANCYSLKEILLPKSLQEVEESAFNHCSSLTKFVCDDKDVVFGKKCFANCISLKEIPQIKSVGSAMFMNCKRLEEVTLYEGCECVSDVAFFKCFALSKIEIPKSLTKIGVFAFRGCESLKEVEIPETVLTVEDGAFYNCKQLTKVVCKNKNILGKCDLFEGCDSLRYLDFGNDDSKYQFEVSFSFAEQMKKHNISCETITVKRSDVLKFGTSQMVTEIQTNKFIHKIDEGCFFMNTEITTIDIPDEVKELGIYAFYNCNNLSKIVISKNITEVPSFCFDGCTNLLSITFKSKIQKYKMLCFNECSQLKGKVDASGDCFELIEDDDDSYSE